MIVIELNFHFVMETYLFVKVEKLDAVRYGATICEIVSSKKQYIASDVTEKLSSPNI